MVTDKDGSSLINVRVRWEWGAAERLKSHVMRKSLIVSEKEKITWAVKSGNSNVLEDDSDTTDFWNLTEAVAWANAILGRLFPKFTISINHCQILARMCSQCNQLVLFESLRVNVCFNGL
jgi:hypothetical protein